MKYTPIPDFNIFNIKVNMIEIIFVNAKKAWFYRNFEMYKDLFEDRNQYKTNCSALELQQHNFLQR